MLNNKRMLESFVHPITVQNFLIAPHNNSNLSAKPNAELSACVCQWYAALPICTVIYS